MKRAILLLSVITLVTGTFSAASHAVEGLSANAAVTNNYIWRGLSQTDDQAAVSGGLDFNAQSGFYIGAWVSNVKYGTATSELDLYVGYEFSVNELLFDGGYLNYNYPAGDNLDFSELYASVSWEFLTVGYNVLVKSDIGGDFGDDDYVFADFVFEISDGLELAFHYGSSHYDAGGNYSDYGISLNKNGLTFSVSDTDKDRDDIHVAVAYKIDFDL